MDTTIAGIDYKTGKLDAFTQLHVARRLAPALANVFSALSNADPDGTGDDVGGQLLLLASTPLAETLARMSDEDVNYVIQRCLAVCERKQDRGWAKVMNTSGTMQFHDMELDSLIGLTVSVVQENLGRFFPTSQPASPGQE